MAGVMPSTQWEMKNYHQKYYPGNTISVGIGQGETQVTPLQLGAGWAALLRTGIWCGPTWLRTTSFQPEFHQAVLTASPALET
jgi:penicillin-binding protein 2